MGKKMIHGHGINDADYVVYPTINGKQVMCKFYQTWCDLLKRVYSNKWHEKYPTYKGCTVCEGWLTFSIFKAWMEQQDWKNKHLDKDILFPNNKHYSPETCVFVTQSINKFLADNGTSRGEYMIGVCWNKNVNKFQANIRHNGKKKYLGYYLIEQDAHNAWKYEKLKQYDVLIDDPVNDYIVSGLIKHRDILNGYKQSNVGIV